MENQFEEGQEVKSIYWDDNSNITVGMNGVDKITVVLENGEFCHLPWFAVWVYGKIISKHNASKVSSVIF